ncbi:hypothetical protein ZHAS_00011918 [Anopheles sinensis]|uniref:Uncharacterized protein n=1 Tax=Anopheles sinensis TaxID=74873 RepID=A0A084W1J0_ANOSI|nr:hypothetical protein ZHAS_00011918 [Anopheles sinensis]
MACVGAAAGWCETRTATAHTEPRNRTPFLAGEEKRERTPHTPPASCCVAPVPHSLPCPLSLTRPGYGGLALYILQPLTPTKPLEEYPYYLSLTAFVAFVVVVKLKAGGR